MNKLLSNVVLMAGLASIGFGSAAMARESIASLSEKIQVLELKTTAIGSLKNCGGTYRKFSTDPSYLQTIGINPTIGLPLPSPSTFGILADSDTHATWDYGYLGTQLYTNDKGNLACGVTVDMQGLVETVLNISFNAVCPSLEVAAASKYPKLELAELAVCDVADKISQTVNGLFWLTVSGNERLKEKLLDGGSPEATKDAEAALLISQEINALTIGIPSDVSALINLIKSSAIDEPLDSFAHGKILIAGVEIDLDEFIPPYEIVLEELERNGDMLLEDPAQFVAMSAQLVIDHYFSMVFESSYGEELIQNMLEASSKLEFIDPNGNQIFNMALVNDGVGTGLNAMGLSLNGEEMISIAPSALGLGVGTTSFDISDNSVNLAIASTQVISASDSDVCLLTLCVSEIKTVIDLFPVDLAEQLGRLEVLSDLIPSDLTTQLGKIDDLTGTVTGLTGSVSGLSGTVSGLSGSVSGLSGTVSGLSGSVSGLSGTVSGLSGSVSGLSGTVSGLSGSVSGIGANLTNLATTVSNEMASSVARIRTLEIAIHYAGIPLNPAASTPQVPAPCLPYVGCLSDARLKTDVNSLNLSLSKILNLQGVSHRWNTEAETVGIAYTDRIELGFIAQDIQQVIPELVFEGEDGYLRVNYTKMAPVLVEGIKEQQIQIASLQTQNAQLIAYLCSNDPSATFCAQ
jgi:hypothetical protein